MLELELELELDGGALSAFDGNEKRTVASGSLRSPIWLPGSVAESVLVDRSAIYLPSLAAWKRREIRDRRNGIEPDLADRWAGTEATSKAELAQRAGVSLARITQVTRAG